MNELRVGVNITGRNSDLLGAIAGSKLALRDLRSETSRTNITVREATRQARDLDRALRNQARSAQLLTLRFSAVRESIRTLGIRVAVTNFAALAASVNAAALGVGILAQQMSKLAVGGMTVGLSSVLALTQGFKVAGLAFEDVGKAMKLTGEEQAKAMEKLTGPARDFVLEMNKLKTSYRDLQVLAQKGMFPGVVRGIQEAKVAIEPLRDLVYSTAVTFGYLAEEAGKAVARNVTDLKALGDRNVVTFRRMGISAINFGEALVDILREADPYIAHVTSGMVEFSESIRDTVQEARDNGDLAKFFKDLKESTDDWLSITGDGAKTIFNIFRALDPTANKATKGIKEAFDSMEKWTGSTKGQKSMREFFERTLPTLSEMLRLVGSLAETFVKLGDAGNGMAQRMFKGVREKVLPLLEDLFHNFNDKIAPALGDLVSAAADFGEAIMPGLRFLAGGVGEIIGGFGDLLKAMADVVRFFDQFGGAASVIASLAVTGAVIGSWRTLRLLMLQASQSIGLSQSKAVVTRQTYLNAIPGLSAGRRAVGRLTPQGRIDARMHRAGIDSPYAGAPALAGAAYGGSRYGGAVGPRSSYNGRVYDPWNRTHMAVNRVYQRAPFERVGSAMPVGATSPSGVSMAALPISSNGADRDPRTGRFVQRNTGALYTRSADGRLRVGGQFAVQPNGGNLNVNGGRTNKGATMYREFLGQQEKAVETSTRRGFIKGMSSGVKGAFGAAGPAVRTVGATAGFMALATFAPGAISDMSHRMSGKTKKYNLPKTQHLGFDATGGFLDSLVTGGGDEAKLRKFGDTAEDAFRKLSKAKDVKGLRELAADARALANEFPKASGPLSAFAKDVADASTGVADQFRQMKDSGGYSLALIRDSVKQTTEAIKYRLGTDTRIGKDALVRNFDIAIAAVEKSMDAGVITTEAGLKEIGRLLGQQLKLYGVNAKLLRAPDGESKGQKNALGGAAATYAGAARGGLIQLGREGAAGRDTIPTMLNGQPVIAAEGEQIAVFNRHQRADLDGILSEHGYGGVKGFFAKNNKPNYMAKGGMVSGDTDYSPKLGSALSKMATAKGQPIYVQSGGRTMGEQAALYARYKAGGNLAAAPNPNAPHVRGIAADITPGREAFGGSAGKFGLGFTVPSESWHVELLNAALAGSASARARLQKMKVAGGGAVGALANAGLGKVHASAENLLNLAIAKYGGGDAHMPGGAGNGLGRSEIAKLMREAGFPNSEIRRGVAIALAESGGDPSVQNSIGATGLWQILLSAHPEMSESTARNPILATQYAYKLWQQSGWQPWEAFTNGAFEKYMARGGLIRAFAGAPPSKLTAPGRDKAAEATPKSKGKKSSTVLPSGARPQSTPFGSSMLGRGRTEKQKKQAKLRMRKAVQRAKGKFGGAFKDSMGGGFIDPLTGESYNDLSNVKALKDIIKLQNAIPGMEDAFSIMVGRQDLTDNDTPDQRVAELNEQLVARGAIKGNLDLQKLTLDQRIGDRPEPAIKERRDRLARMRELFRKNLAIRKSTSKKLNNMNKKGYDWKDAVRDNDDLLDKWRDFKRSGSDLPENYRENIDRIMDRIRNTNEDLRRRKPKGGDKHTRIALQDDYNVATRVNRYLVGDGEAGAWNVSGGQAYKVKQNMDNWSMVKDFRDGLRLDLGRMIPSEELNIEQIKKDIKDAGGRPSELDKELLALEKSKSMELAMENALLKGKFDVYKGFAGMVEGRMVGSFAHGGVITQTGMALVHKDERIIPDPDGPYRRGMNAPAMTSQAAGPIQLTIIGDPGFIDKVEAKVAGKIVPVVSETMGRKTRTITAAPGGRR